MELLRCSDAAPLSPVAHGPLLAASLRKARPKWPKVAPAGWVQCFSSSNDPTSLMSKTDSNLTPCSNSTARSGDQATPNHSDRRRMHSLFIAQPPFN